MNRKLTGGESGYVPAYGACRVRGTNTTQELLIILVFKLFCEFYAFSKDEQKFDNKHLMDNLKVTVGI